MGRKKCRRPKPGSWVTAALVSALVLLGGYAQAGEVASEPEQPMVVLAPMTLEDQHGAEHVLDANVRAILYSRDRKGGFVMTRAMEGHDGDFLATRGVLYVNDISEMPIYVANLFALPKMRRRAYPILLDRTSEATAALPDEDEKASLIHLEDMKIRQVDYFEDSDALAAQLEKLPKVE